MLSVLICFINIDSDLHLHQVVELYLHLELLGVSLTLKLCFNAGWGRQFQHVLVNLFSKCFSMDLFKYYMICDVIIVYYAKRMVKVFHQYLL